MALRVTTKRLEAFSDGVLAIILTIMALELKLPDLSKDNSTQAITNHLLHLLPYFVTYAFSFMMIALFWFNHHSLFHLLEKTDAGMVWQNALFLFLVSLVPFITGIVGSSPNIPLSPALYGIVMLFCTISFAFMRHHSLAKRLLHNDADDNLTKQVRDVSIKARKKALIACFIYLASIPLAFISVYLAYSCFIIPPIIFFVPDAIDDEKMAEMVDKKNT